jgi:hypothetical protein
MNSVAIAYSKPTVTRKPRINGNPYTENGSVRVRHREYLQDLPASDPYLNVPFSINPGLSSTFPWLSGMARLFESYKFHKLKFCYEPTCTTVTPGSVLLAVDFDASDPPPVSKTQIMSYHNAVRSAPWEGTSYTSAVSDLLKFGTQRYVRSGAITGDIKTYDVGNFFIATQGSVGTAATIGEIYVEYDIELYTPQISDPVATLASSHVLQAGNSLGITSDTVVFSQDPIFDASLGTSSFTARGPGRFLMVVSSSGASVPLVVAGSGTTIVPIAAPAAAVQSYIVTFTNAASVFTVPILANVPVITVTIRMTAYPTPLA